MGLVKALARVGRIDLVRKIFHAGADHHAGNHPTFGDHVEHGDLFSDSLRMIVERQHVAENHQLRLLGAARQTGRHDIRRRHAAVSGLMVLVDAHAVEA